MAPINLWTTQYRLHLHVLVLYIEQAPSLVHGAQLLITQHSCPSDRFSESRTAGAMAMNWKSGASQRGCCQDYNTIQNMQNCSCKAWSQCQARVGTTMTDQYLTYV